MDGVDSSFGSLLTAKGGGQGGQYPGNNGGGGGSAGGGSAGPSTTYGGQTLPQEKRNYKLSNQVMLVPLDMETVVELEVELLHTTLEVVVVPVVPVKMVHLQGTVGMVVQENKHLQSLEIHRIHMDTLDLHLEDSGLQVEAVVVHRLDPMELVADLVVHMPVQEMDQIIQQIMFQQLLHPIIVDLVVVVLVTYQVSLLILVNWFWNLFDCI